jgi:hypothetical protein
MPGPSPREQPLATLPQQAVEVAMTANQHAEFRRLHTIDPRQARDYALKINHVPKRPPGPWLIEYAKQSRSWPEYGSPSNPTAPVKRPREPEARPRSPRSGRSTRQRGPPADDDDPDPAPASPAGAVARQPDAPARRRSPGGSRRRWDGSVSRERWLLDAVAAKGHRLLDQALDLALAADDRRDERRARG